MTRAPNCNPLVLKTVGQMLLLSEASGKDGWLLFPMACALAHERAWILEDVSAGRSGFNAYCSELFRPLRQAECTGSDAALSRAGDTRKRKAQFTRRLEPRAHAAVLLRYIPPRDRAQDDCQDTSSKDHEEGNGYLW